MLGIRSEHFAIPFGKREHYNDTVLSALAHDGYRYVYTSNPSHVGDLRPGWPRIVPRVGVTDEAADTVLFHVNRALITRVDL